MEQKTIKIDDLLRRIGYALRKYWIVIVAFVVAAAAIGFVYSSMQKVTYTATCKMVYLTKDLNAKSTSSSYTNVTLSKNYLPTVTSFCRQGCVLERANYYYYEYKNSNEAWQYVDGDTTYSGIEAYKRKVNDRVEKARIPYLTDDCKDEYESKPSDEWTYTDETSGKVYTGKDAYVRIKEDAGVNPYKSPAEFDTYLKYLQDVESGERKPLGVNEMKASSFGVSSSDETLAFTFSYSDQTAEIAREKVQIAIMAVEHEAVSPGEAVSEGTMQEWVSQYFYNAKVVFNSIDGDSIPCYNNMNKARTVTIFAIVGLAVSLFVVYLINVLNKSMRDKDELERISGVNVLAFIGDQDGGR